MKHSEPVMGTVFSIHVNDPGDWSAAIRRAVSFLHRVDRVFSTYHPDSHLNRLSRQEIRLADCPPAVAEVLAMCAVVTRRSGGYFSARYAGRLDPTGMAKGWAVERASAMSRPPASLYQQVRSPAPIFLPEIGWWIGTPAQARFSRFSA